MHLLTLTVVAGLTRADAGTETLTVDDLRYLAPPAGLYLSVAGTDRVVAQTSEGVFIFDGAGAFDRTGSEQLDACLKEQQLTCRDSLALGPLVAHHGVAAFCFIGEARGCIIDADERKQLRVTSSQQRLGANWPSFLRKTPLPSSVSRSIGETVQKIGRAKGSRATSPLVPTPAAMQIAGSDFDVVYLPTPRGSIWVSAHETQRVDEPQSARAQTSLRKFFSTCSSTYWARSPAGSPELHARLEPYSNCPFGPEDCVAAFSTSPSHKNVVTQVSIPVDTSVMHAARRDEAAVARRALALMDAFEQFRRGEADAGQLGTVLELPSSPFDLVLIWQTDSFSPRVFAINRETQTVDAARTQEANMLVEQANCWPRDYDFYALQHFVRLENAPGRCSGQHCIVDLEWDTRSKRIVRHDLDRELTELNRQALNEFEKGNTAIAIERWQAAETQLTQENWGVKPETLSEICTNLGYALQKSGQLNEAEKKLSTCVNHLPTRGLPELNLAQVLLGLERDDEALAHFEQALEVELTARQRQVAQQEVARLLAKKRESSPEH